MVRKRKFTPDNIFVFHSKTPISLFPFPFFNFQISLFSCGKRAELGGKNVTISALIWNIENICFRKYSHKYSKFFYYLILIAYPTNNHVSAHNTSHNTPLLWTFWTRFDPAASHLRKIRGWGPLAPLLQSVWHAHCDVIAAESHWWKTLSLLKQVISINIYTGAAGNDTSRRFSVCGDENGKKSDVNEGIPAQECLLILLLLYLRRSSPFARIFFFKSLNPPLKFLS